MGKLQSREYDSGFQRDSSIDPSSPQSPIGGILYYITPPRSLEVAVQDPVRAIVYIIFLTTIVTIFAAYG